jgi:hypothetical protein
MKKKKVFDLQAVAMAAKEAEELSRQMLLLTDSIGGYYQAATLSRKISNRYLHQLANIAINYGSELACECIDICVYKFDVPQTPADFVLWGKYTAGIINTKLANGEITHE